MPLPKSLQTYEDLAKKYLGQNLVRSIHFSEQTYQIEIHDPETDEEVWPFVQLNKAGQIKDSFCSCDESDESGGCVHVAMAIMKIYQEHSTPLHRRFHQSLWNQLCLLFADRMGYDENILKQVTRGQYACYSVGGKVVFYAKGRTAKGIATLNEILVDREEETEETSIKFSNLNQDEINLWRQGNPPAQLKYELSFWSDLAKWMMLEQDSRTNYQISFGLSPNKLPNRISIEFPNIEFEFYLSEANLTTIIPTLGSVNSPLKLHQPQEETIQAIRFEQETGTLTIEQKGAAPSLEVKSDQEGIPIDHWVFVPGDGFYPRDQDHLLKGKTIQGNKIGKVLDEQWRTIKTFLDGNEIHEERVSPAYAISFDKNWNLHISSYLFKEGDLSQPHSHIYPHWVYIQDDGFYQIEDLYFDEIEHVIPNEEVAQFVQQHRSWLNLQEGFKTQLTSLQAQLDYHVDQDSYLTFERRIKLVDESVQSKDFGPWVYVAGQGFYSKVSSNVGLPVRPGIALKPDQIPLFIRLNQEELKLVPGFFSEKCPVKKPGLNIQLLENETIQIFPEYQILSEYKNKNVRIFDDYAYVPGEGFHALPVIHRLPERFRHTLTLEKDNLPLFLSYEMENIQKYATKTDPRLMKPSFCRLVAEKFEKRDGEYACELHFETDRGKIPVTDIWSGIKKKQRFLFHTAGLIDLEDEQFDWVRSLRKGQVDRKSNEIQLTPLELIRLNAMEQIEMPPKEAVESGRQFFDELTDFSLPSEPDITGLKSTLRSYQQMGVHWLWFLYRHQLAGLLCDDMGLGKTHQTMALIAAVQNEKKDGLPHLVVCPTSVIYHWQEKLEDFLPGVNVCTYHGTQRSVEDLQKPYDILLTSYGLWRREKPLHSIRFELAIFDEIQAAKNPASRLHASLLRTKAKMRLGLTGTPIENRLRELKSLFDIVLPSYMLPDPQYRKFFINPIERESNEHRKSLLKRVIKPFMLRRKKEDVLFDLPEKTEEIAHCTLAPEQTVLYSEVLMRSRESVLQDLENGQAPIPFVHIFAILTSLKQICNHPASYLKTPLEYKNYQSGKWDLFVELLEEARNSKQKVVVYSQYLAMLDIIEEYLNEMGIGYASIRGSTIKRGEQVQRFNQDPRCEVFVASLQAAGLGIDLTAGSVVIHYDRWWNAAKENQATDRVHRIGQTRGVQVFKLVTKGTFEERIDELISQKGKLMEDVVGVDDHQIVKQFTRDELLGLLEDVQLEMEE